MALEDIVKKASKLPGAEGTAIYEMLCCLESTEDRCEVTFPKDCNQFLLKALGKMMDLVKEDMHEEIMKLPLYKREFYNAIENFGLAELPKFLENGDWEDESWHNNEMPCWWNKKLGLVLWVNFKDKAGRGSAEEQSYMLTKESREDREDLGMHYTGELLGLEEILKNW